MAPPRGRPPHSPLSRFNGVQGFSLVEIVVALGVIVFAITAVLALIGSNYGRINTARDQSEGMLLVQEAANAVRNIARRDWEKLDEAAADNGSCEPDDCEKWQVSKTGDLYTLVSGTQQINTSPKTTFFRTVTVMPAYRDAGGNIGEQGGGGTLDPNAYVVMIDVWWVNSLGTEVHINPTLIVTKWTRDAITYDLKEDFTKTNDAKFHNTMPVKEIFNGEVRSELAGNMVSPVVIGNAAMANLSGTAEERVLEMTLKEDDLFVASVGKLRRYSIADISRGIITEVASVTDPLYANNISTLDLDDTYIYAGLNQGLLSGFAVLERSKFNQLNMNTNQIGKQVWSNLLGANIKVVLRDPKFNRLYVGRVNNTNSLFFEFEALDIDDSLRYGRAIIAEPDGKQLRKDLNQTVNSIAFDDKYIFVGTQSSRVYILDRSTGQTMTTLDLPSQTQPILDIAVADGNLFIALDNGGGPEIVKYAVTTVEVEGEDFPVLVRIAEKETGAQVSRVLPIAGKTWLIAVTGNSAERLKFLDSATLLDMEDEGGDPIIVSMSNVGGKNVNGSNCRGIVYEQDRIFFGCETDSVASPGTITSELYMIEDGGELVGFPDWGSYVSPVQCVPTGHSSSGDFAWKHLAYTEEGLGSISIQVRAGINENDTKAAPWSTTVFSDDTNVWHDLAAALGAANDNDPCMQFRAVFKPSPSCALSLQSITMTYQH